MRARKKPRRLIQILSFGVSLGLVLLALPCDCMAIQSADSAKPELPCHSSEKTSGDQETQHDENCCCSGRIDLRIQKTALPTMILDYVPDQDHSSKTSGAIFTTFAYWSTVAPIRGSPPTQILPSHPISITLAFLQRWII